MSERKMPGNTPVSEHDAFAQRNYSPLYEEVVESTVYTWHIENYKNLERRVTSEEFECGGSKWNVLLFPTGNMSSSGGQMQDMVSIYLNHGDQKVAEGWHVCAQFILVISNPNDPTNYVQSQAHHRFNSEEQDWGFTRFVELRKLLQPMEGRSRPIIENDSVVITAFLRVVKDPTGVLWHNLNNYDSKKMTGYVGLRNQGATCYMNSLLQSMFFTNSFRRMVYQTPTEDEDAQNSVALALQRVFYNLQTSTHAVGTSELTRSFGWRDYEAFMQHDVQEFNRVLQDKLETKMKGTPVDGKIKDIFAGKMKSYIRCLDVQYESSRVEDFYDIQLNVKGLKNLEESFRDYIAVETLDGDNKYSAGDHGLQDAHKGVLFESFPPVLHLQLKRFEYDMIRDSMVKINDRYEYPLSIDLSPFVPDEERALHKGDPDFFVYELAGVLVHAGDLHGGHYFAYINPTLQSETEGWFRFDDDRVIPATVRDVLEENYGGEIILPPGTPPNNTRMPIPSINTAPLTGQQQPSSTLNSRGAKRFTNAYMLVYIRRSDKQTNTLAPITTADVPQHLRDKVDAERKELEKRRRERDEQNLYLNVKISTMSQFTKYQGFDLATFDDRWVQPTELPTLRVLKTTPIGQIFQKICEYVQIAPNAKTDPAAQSYVNVWVQVHRQNKTTRPDSIIPLDEKDPTATETTVETVRDRMAPRQTELKVFVEVRQKSFDQSWPYPEEPLLIFLKHFDVTKKSLVGLCHLLVHQSLRGYDLQDLINDYINYPRSTPLLLYEEVKPGLIEQLSMNQSLYESEIQTGDIICFQVDIPEKDRDDHAADGLIVSVPQFYNYFLSRVSVSFVPKYLEAYQKLFDNSDDTNAPQEFDPDYDPETNFAVLPPYNESKLDSIPPKFVLTLSKKSTYELIASAVATRLGIDPTFLRLTQADGPNNTPKSVIRRQLNMHLSECIQSSYYSVSQNVIYYEILNVPIIELDVKRSLKVSWLVNNEISTVLNFLLPKKTSIHDLIDVHIRNLVTLPPNGSNQIRVFSIDNGTTQHPYSNLTLLRDILDSSALFAEETPLDEARADSSTKIIPVFHFHSSVHNTHSVPFKFVLFPSEKFADTKVRIAARATLPEPLPDFFLVQSHYANPIPIKDTDILYDHKWSDADMLGINHQPRLSRRPQNSLMIR